MAGIRREIEYPAQEKFKGFGHVPGFPVGSRFESRQKCHEARVHASSRGGIAGDTKNGAYSVVLSKGYPDDKDEGNVVYYMLLLVTSEHSHNCQFVFPISTSYQSSPELFLSLVLLRLQHYTGSGGRNSEQAKEDWYAPQVADQEFTLKNRALQISYETQNPIRVIRGHEGNPLWSPIEGYRYDGLYKVVEAWRETGSSEFQICRYKFVREPNQPPIPTRSTLILKRNKPKKFKKVPPLRKIDTSRAGIRVRERQEEERLRREEIAAQQARMRLKRNASTLSETEENSQRRQPPSKRIMSGQMGKRALQSPTISPPTSPVSMLPPSSSRPLWKPPKDALGRAGLGKLNLQTTKRGRDDPSSPISPDAVPSSPISSDFERGMDPFDSNRQRKRIRPSLSESLQERMQMLSLPGPSSVRRP